MDDARALARRPATFTHEGYESTGHLYYFRPVDAAPGPHTRQRHVQAIVDIADDGTLAGVELIDDMPPPPIDRLAAPEGVGLTRYGWVRDDWADGGSRLALAKDGEWVRHEDAAAALAAEAARADEEGQRLLRAYENITDIEAERDALKAALEAMRAWISVVADHVDLDADETSVTINAVGPDGKREVARRSLRQIYEQADAALSKTQGGG